jgi:hypothetical protein
LNLLEQILRFLPQPNHRQSALDTLLPSESALHYEHKQRELTPF